MEGQGEGQVEVEVEEQCKVEMEVEVPPDLPGALAGPGGGGEVHQAGRHGARREVHLQPTLSANIQGNKSRGETNPGSETWIVGYSRTEVIWYGHNRTILSHYTGMGNFQCASVTRSEAPLKCPSVHQIENYITS